MNGQLNQIILNNKKFLNMPLNMVITPEYTKKVSEQLKKKGVSDSDRTALGTALSFIPIVELSLDIDSIVTGLLNGDKAEFNTGIIGMSGGKIGKALMNAFDYLSDLIVGKEQTDYNINKRKELINMTDNERIALFNKYGYGGYDKWVKDGMPPLTENFVNEEESELNQDSVEDITNKLNSIMSQTYINYTEEDYGLDKDIFNWFKRRYTVFNVFLAEDIHDVMTGENDWLLEYNRAKFIDYLLINSLLNFFHKVLGEEYDGEDFKRNGSKEGWLYFVRDIYEDEISSIYDELKN